MIGLTLADAFEHDPFFGWVFPDAERRSAQLGAFWAYVVEGLPGGARIDMTTAAECVALWHPPKSATAGADDAGEFVSFFSELVGPTVAPSRLQAFGEIVGGAPAEPHWYLTAIGTRSTSQGHGWGSTLLRRGLARSDRARLPAYLESTNPRNVPFYHRHGFQEIGRLDVGETVITRMWRDVDPG